MTWICCNSRELTIDFRVENMFILSSRTWFNWVFSFKYCVISAAVRIKFEKIVVIYNIFRVLINIAYNVDFSVPAGRRSRCALVVGRVCLTRWLGIRCHSAISVCVVRISFYFNMADISKEDLRKEITGKFNYLFTLLSYGYEKYIIELHI